MAKHDRVGGKTVSKAHSSCVQGWKPIARELAKARIAKLTLNYINPKISSTQEQLRLTRCLTGLEYTYTGTGRQSGRITGNNEQIEEALALLERQCRKRDITLTISPAAN